MKSEFGFDRFSVTKALKGYQGVGTVARTPRFVVETSRYQLGPKGDRRTVVAFRVTEVTCSGKWVEFRLPDGFGHNLPKLLAYLSTLHGPTRP